MWLMLKSRCNSGRGSGRLDKRIVAADVIDLSVIGNEETVAPSLQR